MAITKASGLGRITCFACFVIFPIKSLSVCLAKFPSKFRLFVFPLQYRVFLYVLLWAVVRQELSISLLYSPCSSCNVTVKQFNPATFNIIINRFIFSIVSNQQSYCSTDYLLCGPNLMCISSIMSVSFVFFLIKSFLVSQWNKMRIIDCPITIRSYVAYYFLSWLKWAVCTDWIVVVVCDKEEILCNFHGFHIRVIFPNNLT